MKRSLGPFPRRGNALDQFERSLGWARSRVVFFSYRYPLLSGLAIGAALGSFQATAFVLLLMCTGHWKF